MSNSNSDRGCAVRPDGTLKDALEIDWDYDPDDAVAEQIDSTTEASSSSAPPKIHPFFTGARRSTRAARPSARTIDPDNVMNAPAKRKASSPTQKRRLSRRIIVESQSDGEINDENYAESIPDTTDVEEIEESGDSEYERLKEMADADHQAINYKRKSDATADLRTIFKRDTEYKHPDTGKVLDGHWCKVCLEDPDIRRKDCFFTGSTSSLRTHIARKKNHTVLYQNRCASKGITTNPRALRRNPTESSDGLQQGTLDSIVTCEPKIPPFTTAGLLDHIIEMIVSEDKALQLIDRRSFCQLIRFCRPGLMEKEIPKRQTLKAEILRRAQVTEETIRNKLSNIPGKISFTFDAWTSGPGDPYLSITGHYIDAPADRPGDWELKSEQLAFVTIEGCHTGKNMAQIIMRTVDRYNLRGKIGWFTCDGAAVNGTTICELEKELDSEDPVWKARDHDILCMEHSVHVACKHFVEAVAPARPATNHNKINDWEDGDRDEEDGDVTDEVDEDFTAGDVLGKALALVKQIRASPQARTFFHASCIQVNIKPLELLLWIRTRWASLYKFLDRILTLRKGVDQFVQLADSSDNVPNLSKNRRYDDFQLSKREWDKLEVLREVLREPADIQQTFSSERSPTIWRIIPSLEFMIKRWENMAEQPHFRDVGEAITEGVDSFKKWYRKVDNTSDAYFVCLVLDPNVKDQYCRSRWEPKQYKAGMKRLEEVFDAYYIPPPKSTTLNPATTSNTAPINRYGGSFLFEAVQSLQQEEKASGSPRDELKMYLESGIETTLTAVQYWGQQSENKYPTLKRIARDYLAIQGSATPSERAFSSGRITDSARRNRLSTKLFGALQILKSGYRNGHIAAVYQAADHVDDFDFTGPLEGIASGATDSDEDI